MREALVFVFLILLVWVGWRQPYSEHFGVVAGVPTPEAKIATPTPAPDAGKARPATPAPHDRSWMFAPTKMDAPYSSSGSHGR
jgi:hypothetical protein